MYYRYITKNPFLLIGILMTALGSIIAEIYYALVPPSTGPLGCRRVAFGSECCCITTELGGEKMIFVGDDWAEDHHDIHVMDADGARLASRRLPEGLAGIRGFHELVAAHVEEPGQVVIGIETDRGLWVQALGAAGYQVFAVNPLAVARYRDRHQVSGAKSDAGDAKLLADLVRTDRHNHRPLAGDSPDVEAIKVLARAHQNLIWARTRHTNALRSALREYYPGALDTRLGASAITVSGAVEVPRRFRRRRCGTRSPSSRQGVEPSSD